MYVPLGRLAVVGLLATCFAIILGTSANAAGLEYPLAGVVNGEGDIFVADRNLPGIWKIHEGELSIHFQAAKKFGTPLNAVRCLALDHEGKLLAGDSATREVYRFDAEGKPQPLTSGGIGIPIAIATNKAGDIFVADLEVHDENQHVIYKVPAAGGKPEKFADVLAPRGLTIDSQDNLWVVCHRNDLLIKLAPDGKQSVVIAGQPLAAPAFPAGIVLDKENSAYIADGYSKTIWKVAGGGKPVSFATGKPLVHPVGLAWRGDQLLVTDPRAAGLIEIDPQGKMTALKLKPTP